MATANPQAGSQPVDLVGLVTQGWQGVQAQVGQRTVPGITATFQNTETATEAAKARTELEASQLSAARADSLDDIAARTAQRNVQTVDMVQAIYDQSIGAITQGRQLAEQNLLQSMEATAERDRLLDERPGFFRNPIRFVADSYKAGKLEEEASRAAGVATEALTNVNALVQMAGARMDEATARAQLQGVASDNAAVAQVEQGYRGQMLRIQGAQSAVEAANRAGKDVYNSSMALAQFTQQQQQFDAAERERRRAAADRARDNSIRDQELASDEQAARAYLALHGKPPTGDNVNEARAVVADYKLRRDRAGDTGYSALVRYGVFADDAKDAAELRSTILRSGTVQDANLLGELLHDKDLKSLGQMQQTSLVAAYEAEIMKLKYLEAAKGGYQNGELAWRNGLQSGDKTAIRKQAEQLAATQVRDMPVMEFLAGSAADSPISSGGLNLGNIGTGNVAETQAFYGVGPKAAAVLAEPSVRVLLQQAQTKGGNSQGTVAALQAMYKAFEAAGVPNPQAEVFQVLKQHNRGTVKERSDVKAMVERFGVRPPDRIYIMQGTKPLEVSSPERLRLLLNEGSEALSQRSLTERIGEPLGYAMSGAYNLAGLIVDEAAPAAGSMAAGGTRGVFNAALPYLNAGATWLQEAITSDSTKRWKALAPADRERRLQAAGGNLRQAMDTPKQQTDPRVPAAKAKPQQALFAGSPNAAYIRLPEQDRARLMGEFGQLVQQHDDGTISDKQFDELAAAWQFRYNTAVRTAQQEAAR